MSDVHHFKGYPCAVAGAAVTFGLFSVAQALRPPYFESATTNTLGEKALHLGIMSVLFFLFASVFIAALAWIPLLLASLVAKKWKFNGALYFLVCGALAGALLLACPILLLLPFFFPVDGPAVNQYTHALPLFMLSGSVGGLCTWLRRRRDA